MAGTRGTNKIRCSIPKRISEDSVLVILKPYFIVGQISNDNIENQENLDQRNRMRASSVQTKPKPLLFVHKEQRLPIRPMTLALLFLLMGCVSSRRPCLFLTICLSRLVLWMKTKNYHSNFPLTVVTAKHFRPLFL